MGQLTISAVSGSTDCDNPSYCIDVLADGFNNISIFQFAMDYDTDYLSFDQVTSSFHVALLPQDDPTLGEVAFSWFEFPVSTNLADGSLLYSICFQPTGLAGSTTVDFIDGANTPIQIADGNNNLLVQNTDFFFSNAAITIVDNENPIVTCPNDITVMSSSGSPVNGLAPLATSDNCLINSVDYTISGATMASGTTDASGENFNAGVSTVTYDITDSGMNSGSCSFNVEVIPGMSDFEFIPNVEIDCDAGTVELCVGANNFIDIVGLQVPILWDTATLNYVSTNVFLPQTFVVAEGGIANGVMAFFYNASPALPSGLTIPNGDTMFCTTFDLMAPIDTMPLFNFMDIPGLPITINNDIPYSILAENYQTTDSTFPTLTACPGDTTITAATGTCSAIYTWTGPTADDDCVVPPTLDSTHVSGFDFPLGSTTVTYTATDFAGNPTTCSFVVTVTEADNPTLTCPSDTVITSAVAVVVNDIAPTAGDDCGLATVTWTLTNATTGTGNNDVSGTSFNLGITTVTYTATDNAGNMADCSFTVEIIAPALPDISCPADTSVATGSTNCIATVSDLAPTLLSDPMNVDSISYATSGATVASGLNDISGIDFNLGVTNVTYTVVDLGGNMASCNFNVTVIDTINPTITCPTDTVITSMLAVIVNDIAPTAGDNCGLASVTYTLTNATTGTGSNDASGTSFNPGITTVTYTATDNSGNSLDCSFTVEIMAPGLPDISCPSDTSVASGSALCSATVNDLAPTLLSDPMNVDSISYATTGATIASGLNDVSGIDFNVGVTNVTYTVIDLGGNMASCNFNVTVIDTIPPVVDCKGLDAFENAPGQCGLTVTNDLNPTATDACGIQSVDYVFSGATSGSGSGDPTGTFFNVGITTITFTITDVNGNSSECTTQVWINDSESPTITCPSDTIVTIPAGTTSAVVTDIDPVSITENCNPPAPEVLFASTGATVISITSGLASGQTFNLGASEVTYYVTDSIGNIDSCKFMVTLEFGNLDLLDCPNDTIVSNDTLLCGATVNDIAPILLVPSGDIVSINYLIDGSTMASGMNDASGTFFENGISTVKYLVEDVNGILDSCTFTVTVNDLELPTWSNCPDTIFAYTMQNNCTGIGTWSAPVPADNCGVINLGSSHTQGDVFPFGGTTVTYSAEDAAGNIGLCEFIVFVRDTIAPLVENCPTNISVFAAEDCQTMVNWTPPTGTDPCGIVGMSSTNDPGDVFPVGLTNVTYTYTDFSGNADSCVFTVEVVDTLAPVLNCPVEIVLRIDGTIITDDLGLITGATANASCDNVAIAFDNPTAVDACDGNLNSTQTSGPATGGNFALGNTTLSFAATDNSGNIISCSFDIIVLPLGTVDLAIVSGNPACEGETVEFEVVNPVTGATYDWTGPQSWQANGTNPSRPAISISQAGIYIVECNLAGGCTNTGSIELMVNESPTIAASSNSPICSDGSSELTLFANLTSGPIIQTWSWTGPNFTSADQNPILSNATSADAGTYTVVGVDANGCSATAMTDVSIGDSVTPSLASDCDEIICLGENCTILGSDFVSNDITYNWAVSPAGTAGVIGSTDQNTIEIQPSAAGIYIVTYSAIVDGCLTEEVSLSITVEGAPIANDDDFAIPYETTLEFGSLLNNDIFNSELGFEITIPEMPANGAAFVTDDGTLTYIPNAGYVGGETFNYQLCHPCNGTLCTTGQVNINVTFDGDCEVPTVISPNGDGMNDAIIINCLLSGELLENTFTVYNLWGDQVYTASPYNNDWEGTHEGEALPDGTYYFIFQETANSDPEKGFITVLR